MTSSMPVSEDKLKDAFALAQGKLRGDCWNAYITEKITDDTKGNSIQWETLLDKLFEESLKERFLDCDVRRNKALPGKSQRIDLRIVCDELIAVAMECKGMVANSREGDLNGGALEVWGIRRKLYERKDNSVKLDIARIGNKIPANMDGDRLEVFVPVIYELYREGANHDELFKEGKPWTSHLHYLEQRESLKTELKRWFQSNYPNQFKLLYSAESVELSDANRIWRDRHEEYPPCTPITKAYVSFYAFSRTVRGRSRK